MPKPDCLLVDASASAEVDVSAMRRQLEAWSMESGGRPAVLLVDQQAIAAMAVDLQQLGHAGLLSAICVVHDQAASRAAELGSLWRRAGPALQPPESTELHLQLRELGLELPPVWRLVGAPSRAHIH